MTKQNQQTVLYRQGDVLFRKISKLPDGERRQRKDATVAYGEVTGHHHSLPKSAGTLTLDEQNVTYLTIEELTEVTHQEHGAITLEPGLYEVRQQREFSDDDEPIRNVLD